jgi:hypothetical protein
LSCLKKLLHVDVKLHHVNYSLETGKEFQEASTNADCNKSWEEAYKSVCEKGRVYGRGVWEEMLKELVLFKGVREDVLISFSFLFKADGDVFVHNRNIE